MTHKLNKALLFLARLLSNGKFWMAVFVTIVIAGCLLAAFNIANGNFSPGNAR